jgi:Sec-independent protein translocase protein TatA
MGMMRHFFADGDMSMFPMMFPMFVAFMFIAMMVVRSLVFGRNRFGPMGRGVSRRRGRFHRDMFLDGVDSSFSQSEVRAQPSAQPQPTLRRQPAKSQKAKVHSTKSPMQANLDRARVYQEQINILISTTSDQRARARLQNLTVQVDEWVGAIKNLVERIDRYYQNNLIRQDLKSVPQAVAELEARLSRESNETTRIELERTIASRKKQLAALEQLQTTIKRAEINIESTLSALGTIYSQMLTAQSTNQVADYSRLSAEADEEVRTLQDHLEALAEVKLGAVAFNGA